MDQRRLFLFLTLCFLLLIMFGPKPKPPQDQQQEEAAQIAEAVDQEAAGDGEAATMADETAEGDEQPAESIDEAEIEGVEADLEYVTLGSVAPDSPYRLLVTLTNQGAGVRRVELSSKRFRDLHDRRGYLGHLELVPAAEGGLRIQSLGAGTPAAEAGLKVGDRIVSYTSSDEAVPLTAGGELLAAIKKRKPGKPITLQVVSGDAEPVDHEITLARRPLEVIRPEIENVLMRTSEVPAGVTSPPSFQFTFEQLKNTKISPEAEEIVGVALRDSHWEISEQNETSVTFRTVVPKFNLEVKKTYRLEQVPDDQLKDKNYPGYDLTLDLEVRNLGEESLPFRYRLDGPNGLPVEGWWYANKVGRNWGAAGIRDVIARHVGNDAVQFGPSDIAADKVEPMQGPPMAFAGIDAQYFSAIMLPVKPSLETLWIDELRSESLSPKPKERSNEGRYVNATCRLISHEQQVAAGETFKHTYDIFLGPKRPELLVNYQANENTQYSLKSLMYYGWFSTVSRAMLGILHFFYGIVGNYGIAIILLTVLVRSCMFPISRKQASSMAKMQELRPEMDALKEKYKQDMQKQSQAMQELYRKHKINPLAGCLPMFLQLPIFLGLYRALMVDVELRQAPLLGDSVRWCSNLAAPDMFFDWSKFVPEFISSGEGILGLGPYLNILPLVTMALFMLQQKMFMPEPTNEQAAMQQKIMKFMMFFMGFLFFKVAAGLCLYFIASSLWGIAERKMLPKPEVTPALATASGPAVTNKPSRNGSSERAAQRRKKAKKKKR